MKIILCMLVLFISLGAFAQANPEGVMVRQATVYADASSASQAVGNLRAGVRVSVFDRKGGWKEIYSKQKAITGWVRVYQVREGNYTTQANTPEQEDSRGFLAGLASFSRKASGFFTQDNSATSSSTATIGVRGLSEDEIKSAKADFRELKKMKKFASNRQRMSKFRTRGSLKASKVSHISGLKE
ncbi:MAG: hypothetical protein GY815_13615 [Gammaproteobacteria bacterium]|nr:hypothetical protein [Gammaproteobacteria bacterium]